jgi:hypothetical protein
MDTSALLDVVVDQATFLAFARALQADREAAFELERKSDTDPYGPGAGGWENVTIESFLERAIAWAKDSRFGASQGLSSANPWKQFAVFLYAGKIYE